MTRKRTDRSLAFYEAKERTGVGGDNQSGGDSSNEGWRIGKAEGSSRLIGNGKGRASSKWVWDFKMKDENTKRME